MRLVFFITLLPPYFFGFSQTTKSLDLALQQLLADEDLKNASIGFYALDLTTHKTVGTFNAYKSLVPASTMKLITTATALEILGTEKRFATRLYYSGKIDTAGVLHGNIYIVGGGDPCLGAERYKKHYGNFMEQWAATILEARIDSIAGKVIGDATLFSTQMAPATWTWEDMGNYYGAGACGLSIYENKCQVELSSSGKGATTKVVCVSPFIPHLKYNNEVKGMPTRKDLSYIFGSPYQEERSIRGGIPLHQKSFTIKGTIPDPAYMAAFELDMELRRMGIKLAQTATTIRRLKNVEAFVAPPEKHLLSTIWSPKLIDIVTLTNRHSINLYAEHLVKHIGLHHYNDGTTESGTKAIALFWKEKGIDIDGLYIKDGSGLSRFNGVTSQQLVSILKHMNKFENSTIFFNSLPVAGKSGTLRNVLKGTTAAGKTHAKSGTMNRVKSYAGYVIAKNKHKIAFAILVNNYNCTSYKIKKKLEKIMLELAKLEE